MVSGKKLVGDWERKASLARSPFIPFVHTYAARLAGLSAEEMLWDPGKWSQTLLAAKRLFGYDGVVVSFDSTLEAEALGCDMDWDTHGPRIGRPLTTDEWLSGDGIDRLQSEGRTPVLLEALKRIQKVEQDAALCTSLTGIDLLLHESVGDQAYAALTSDRTLKNQAYEVAQKAVLKTAKLLAECRPSLLFIREQRLDFAEAERINGWYQPVINLLKYFRVPVVFLLEQGQSSSYPYISYSGAGTSGVQAAGHSIPQRYFNAQTPLNEIEQEWTDVQLTFKQPALLVTAGEISWETDVDRFKDLMELWV